MDGSEEGSVSKPQSSETTCMDYALAGERHVCSGDAKRGVAHLEAALMAGTDDLRLLGAIYSQLGNAYFLLGDFAKALEYHRHDLTLARTIQDKIGEAKASGNLGNTLKVLCKFDEAAACCRRHLEISKELGDKISEARALYNLGNVYNAQAKHNGRLMSSDPGDFPADIRASLTLAVDYYQQNLALLQESGKSLIGDGFTQTRLEEGRTCGNLGNTLYLLGRFQDAITYHSKRLDIAKSFNDKPAIRRAHSNLGNANVMLGEFEEALSHYLAALKTSVDLKESAMEAQACYSLGNTNTLLGDHSQAVEYHLRHLTIARKLQDGVGQARACWSLGHAYKQMSEFGKALYFMQLHESISTHIGDENGCATARETIAHLKTIAPTELAEDNSADPCPELCALRRETTSKPQKPGISSDLTVPPGDEESLLDLIMRSQSKRMDDQRCDAKALNNKENDAPRPNKHGDRVVEESPDLLDLIVGMQSRRMNDQRASLPYLPGLQHPAEVLAPHIARLNSISSANPGSARGPDDFPDDEFFEMLIDCQGKRIDEQRLEMPSLPPSPTTNRENGAAAAATTDEDFFQMISRMQRGRMDEQRAEIVSSGEPSSVSETNSTKSLELHKAACSSAAQQKAPKRTASEKIKKLL